MDRSYNGITRNEFIINRSLLKLKLPVRRHSLDLSQIYMILEIS